MVPLFFSRFFFFYAWTTTLNFFIPITLTTAKQLHRPSTRYVVECKITPSERFSNQTASFRSLIEQHLGRHKVSFKDIRPLDEAPSLFSGFSISVENSRGASILRAADFIQEVYPVRPVSRPVFLNTPRVLSTLTGDKAADLFEPHVQVGIPRLHALGFKCRGIKIAVIDTGCDCKHPVLGGGFGPNFKIAKGHDFVGDAYNGTNEPVPDDNPCATCAVHGTHIMGVLSANDNHMGFRGVCPEATMYSYRVFGCQEDTDDELVAAALLRAYKDGADVFSLSVGAPGGWAGGSVAAVVASRIAQRRVVITSAGNAGEEGMFFATSPSCGAGVLAVGSVQSTALVSYPFTTSATGRRAFNYFATFTMEAGTFPLYPISATAHGRDDACHPLPSTLPDLSRDMRLMTSLHPVLVLFKLSWPICLTKNNSFPEYVTPDGRNKVSVGVVTRDVGTVLREQYFHNPGNFSITISRDLSIDQVAAPDSGKVSPFSTYGPMFDLVSPQPAALGVGGNVLCMSIFAPATLSIFGPSLELRARRLRFSSLNAGELATYPVSAGSFAIASGTSISAPQVAGIAALVMSVQPKGTPPHEIYTRIATSATPVANFSETAVCHQGSGLVNAWCAAMSTTVVSTSSLSLNDTLHFNGTQSVSITNKGHSSIVYTVQHVPAGTALSFSKNNLINHWPVPLVPEAAAVSFSVTEFRLDPGQTFEVQVRFKPPKGLEQITLPVYSGFVILRSELECESHTISYYGVAAPLKERPVFDHGYSYQDNYTLPSLDSGLTGIPVQKGHTFTLQGLDVPIVEYRLAFGSPLILFHLVAADTVLLPRLSKDVSQTDQGQNPLQAVNKTSSTTLQNSQFRRRNEEGLIKLLGLLGPPDDFPGKLINQYLGIPLLGSIRSYEAIERWNPRHALADSSSAVFNGKIYDISNDNYQHAKAIKVPNGEYRILARALRITGDPHEEEDYESWLSPTLTIRRSNNKA